jgi:hypothetical protein
MTVDKFEVQEGYECPTCGDTVDTSVGLKQHHAKVHGESLVQTDTCDWCGETFRVRPSQKGNFCSRECFGKHRSEHGVEARKRRVLISCANCREVFATRESTADTKRYCSDECYYEDSEGREIPCEWCGSYFQVHGKRVDEARFCGQDCYGEWLSEHRSGEQSPLWKGEDRFTKRPDYGPGWNADKRQQIRDRDRHECRICGADADEHRRKYNSKLHVHHIQPARGLSNPAVYNAPRNLITLCNPCHMSVEHSDIDHRWRLRRFVTAP